MSPSLNTISLYWRHQMIAVHWKTSLAWRIRRRGTTKKWLTPRSLSLSPGKTSSPRLRSLRQSMGRILSLKITTNGSQTSENDQSLRRSMKRALIWLIALSSSAKHSCHSGIILRRQTIALAWNRSNKLGTLPLGRTRIEIQLDQLATRTLLKAQSSLCLMLA